MTFGIPTIRRRPWHLRRPHRDHDRCCLCHRQRWRRTRAFRNTPQTRCTCCASCQHRRAAYGETEATAGRQPGPALKNTSPERTGRTPARMGQGGDLGAEYGYRNAQATVVADRHHRPRHGLRHHRHRARLRAGEVHACRWRLLQDHQPCSSRSPAHARLYGEPDREIEAYAVGHGNLNQALASTSVVEGKGFTEEKIEALNAMTSLRHQFVFNQWTLVPSGWRKISLHRRAAQRLLVRDPACTWLFEEGHRGGEHPRLRRDDLERTVPQDEHRPSSIVNPCGKIGSATFRSKATSA